MSLYKMSTYSGSCSRKHSNSPSVNVSTPTPQVNVTVMMPGFPNPKKFTIRKMKAVGDLVIAKIHYPGSQTFEGDKILVFKETESWLRHQATVDPHFDECWPLVARFEPTDRGWSMAEVFAIAWQSVNK